MKELKIAHWNANGLPKHKLELEKFLNMNQIDIMLISETHLTGKNNFKIFGYTLYKNDHPNNKACGGTAILIKNRIKHHPINSTQTKEIQCTTICLMEMGGPINIAAVYCPPGGTVEKDQFDKFFKQLGNKFLAAGDYNAKSPLWGSRITSPRGKHLVKSIHTNNLNCISGKQPTHWPTDRHKKPDIIDFGLSKGLNRNLFNAATTMDLSSDHAPTIIKFASTPITTEAPLRLTNGETNWPKFQDLFKRNYCPHVKLKTEEDIENALHYINDTIKDCAQNATPVIPIGGRTPVTNTVTTLELLKNKRRAKKRWQASRSPQAKAELNRATRKLKAQLEAERNQSIDEFTAGLNHYPDTEYSIWKVTKGIKKPIQQNTPILGENNGWINEDQAKAEAFAKHLEKVFKPSITTISRPTKIPRKKPIRFTLASVLQKIQELNPRKAPGQDKITGQLIKALPLNGKIGILYIFNAILRLNYFPQQWKLAKIFFIPKPGKDVYRVESYRPISLLPILSKLFEKLLLEKLQNYLDNNNIIPTHQFGFRSQHSTIEQIHKIHDKIKDALEKKQYCIGLFLDIAQAFDKVNHNGLLTKIKKLLPGKYYNILQSYLTNRKFQVTYNNCTSKTYQIEAGVPQGSVLGPVLYLLYTADLPVDNEITTTTFADDTALIFAHKNPTTATRIIQEHLNKIIIWTEKWGINLNESKTEQITFTLRKRTCKPVEINGKKVRTVNVVRYLGIHLDRRLTWKAHLHKKKEQIKLTFNKMYWLLNKKSKLSLSTKIAVYKSIIRPIWTYGIQLWGAAKKSNLEIIKRVQSKIIRAITGAPRYVRNKFLLRETKINEVDEIIAKHSKAYLARLEQHPNSTARTILTAKKFTRLKKNDPIDCAKRNNQT